MKIGFYNEPRGQWGPIGPDDLEPGGRGLGGRETCLLYVSRLLAERGHDVDVFAECAPAEVGGVWWRDWREVMTPGLRAYDVGVSFNGARVWAKGGLPSRIHVVHEQCAHLEIGKLDPLVDAYFVLTNWQGWHLNHFDPAMDTDKMVTVGNGVDLRRYGNGAGARHPHRVFYSSSPDRGLHHLLAAWRAVRRAVPDAELWVFYEVARWLPSVQWLMNELGRRSAIIRPYFENPPPGVRFWGMVDPWTLAQKQEECTLWAYPADLTAGTETFCITGLEAAAAGCVMLTTAADCLPEVYGEVAALASVPVDVEGFALAVVRLLTDPEMAGDFRPGRAFAELHTWEIVADRWERELRRLLDDQKDKPE